MFVVHYLKKEVANYICSLLRIFEISNDYACSMKLGGPFFAKIAFFTKQIFNFKVFRKKYIISLVTVVEFLCVADEIR